METITRNLEFVYITTSLVCIWLKIAVYAYRKLHGRQAKEQ